MPKAEPDRTASPKGRAVHRRNVDAQLAVLHAADDLLVERGFAGVTIEGIAARAGVAKQTIYRWWGSKVEILLETLTEDAERALAPPTGGPAVEDLRRYLRSLARFLTNEPAGRVLLALLGEAQHDGAVATTFQDRYLEPQRQRERELLQRGIDAGELRRDLDVDAVLDAVCGPIFLRALTGRRIPRAFIDRLIDDNVRGRVAGSAGAID